MWYKRIEAGKGNMRYVILILMLAGILAGMTSGSTLLQGNHAMQPQQNTEQEPATLSVCPQGPPQCRFSKIKDAIAAAKSGDLILIGAGTYQETLVISKSLRVVGAGRDQVRLRGEEAGKPTITLNVDGGLELLLDGLTIVGAPPFSAEHPCLNQEKRICPDGLEVRGKGALTLTITDIQVVQGHATGIVCSIFEGSSVRLTILRSRIAANPGGGIFWKCPRDGPTIITLSETTISGNGIGLTVAGRRVELDISDSIFSGNSSGVYLVLENNSKLTISRSWFLNNSERGLNIIMSMGGSAKLSQIIVSGNGDGVAFYDWFGESNFVIQDSKLLENKGLKGIREGIGLLVYTGALGIYRNLISGNKQGIFMWRVKQAKISENLLIRNQHGIVIGQVEQVEITENRILENEGWGVTLIRPPCFDVPPHTYMPIIQGKGNEIRDNRKGDLCPEDYPWPPGFKKP